MSLDPSTFAGAGPVLSDGRVCIDNNAAERSMRPDNGWIPTVGDPSTAPAGRDHMTIEALGRALSPVVAGLAHPVGLRPPCGTNPATTFSSRLSGILTLIVARHSVTPPERCPRQIARQSYRRAGWTLTI